MASVSRSRFGDLLRAYRRAAGMTQEELAERSGLSVRGISDLERGVNQAPWRETALALADALELAPADRERLLAARQRSTPQADVASDAQAPPIAHLPPHLALVGRAHEQSQIERLLAGGETPLLLFYGEPGIGKTRLLQDATERAQQAGWTVLRGGSHPDGQHPYAPLIHMLERSLAWQTPAQRRQSLKGCEWMARLLPEVADAAFTPAQTWQLAPEQERRLMFAAVARYLERLADPVGVLLVVDDLQWVAPDALSLLAALLRSTASSSRPNWLRMVAASRDIWLDPDHPLPGMMMDLARDSLVTSVRLGPLESPHADTLLHAALADVEDMPSEERETLIRTALDRAAGVPLFLMSFAREIRVSRGEGNPTLVATDIPWNVAEMTRQRVNGLPPTARTVLAVAAVYGRETPLPLLATVGDLTEQQVIEAVEVACAARLLVESGNASCMFQHDLIREAVVANLSVARKEMLHRRIGAALEADPRRALVEPLAFHYGHSDDTDRAMMYRERAGDQALAVRAYATAEACYREVIAHFATLDAASASGRVQEKLGSLLMGCGKYAAAIGALEGAASSFTRAGDHDGVGRVVAQIGWAHVLGGTSGQGLSRVAPLLGPEGTPHLALPTQVALWRAHAVLLFAQSKYSEQYTSARRAVTLARGASDAGALAKSLRLEGLALVLLGRLDEALPVLRETIRLAEIAGDADSFSAALNDTSAVYRKRGELTASWTHSARAVEVAEQMDDPTAIAFLTSGHGENAYLLGDWAVARRYAERAVAVARSLGSSWVAAYPFMQLASLDFAEGQVEAGQLLLGEALALAEQGQDLQALHGIHALFAEHDLLCGNAADALRRLQPLRDSAADVGKDALTLSPLIGWAYLSLGDVALAADTLGQCMRQAEATGAYLVALEALRMQALLHLRLAQWTPAEKALEDALARARAMNNPYAEAKARTVYGDLFAATSRTEQAREQYAQALAICERLGERLYRAQVEQALSRLPAL